MHATRAPALPRSVHSCTCAPNSTLSLHSFSIQLVMAFSLYSALVWTSLQLLMPPAAVSAAAQRACTSLRPMAIGAAAVIGLTAGSGAYVAGNDAGHAYNDWPLFAGRVVPEQIWDSRLGWRNLFENTATVQFDHRSLAYASLAAVGGVHIAMKRLGGRDVLPRRVTSAATLLGLAVAAQATLGVATLVLYVPIELGVAHQAGALALLTAALNLVHAVHAGAAAGGQAAASSLGKKMPVALAALAAVTSAGFPYLEKAANRGETSD